MVFMKLIGYYSRIMFKAFKRTCVSVVIIALVLGVPPISVKGQEIVFEDLGSDVFYDFVVGPGKTELTMRPGEERLVHIRVSNRMGDDRIFRLGFEDFTGSDDPQRAVQLLGSERGPYSLRDFVFPAANELIIEHGKRAVIPVRVVIPEDAEPGGRYGSVLISTDSLPDTDVSESGAQGGAVIVSRIGVLFFVRIAGEVHESGALQAFGTNENRSLYNSGPIPLEIFYENDGSIHLNPYGRIQITNIAGQVIGESEIDPWFVMPGTIRVREITWDRPFLFGRYTAHLEMNRGYGDLVDERSVSFWVIPLKMVLLILGGLFVLIFIIRFLATRIEIKVK